MGRLLESSVERRLQSFRRDLTLDLFTRHGSFWERVDEVRRRWHIEVVARVPPAPDLDHAHLPPLLNGEDRGARAVREHPDFIRWSVLLGQLHAEFVPETHHVVGASFRSEDVWDGFLSGCLLYDPPAGDLLAYADAPVAAYGDFLNALAPWEEADADAPQMFGAPIRYLYDTDELLDWEEQRRARLVDALHALLEPRGFDVWEFVYNFDFQTATGPSLKLLGATMPAKGGPMPKPFIEVGPATTEEDVRGAFRILAARFGGKRPQAIRPQRDRLTAVQCAIWHDEEGWSQERIAARFGWTVQRPPGMTPRCETARQYVNEGRDILLQRKVAA